MEYGWGTHSTSLGRIKIKSKNVAVVVVLIRYLWCVQNILGIWTLVTKCICIMSFQNSAILNINRGCNYYLFYTNILEYFLRYKCLIYKATYWYELYICTYIRYYFFISLRCFQKTSKLDKVQRYAYFYLLCTFQVLTKDSFTFFPCYIKINNIHKSRGAPLYICIMYVLNRSNAEQESSSVTSQLFDHDVSVVVCLDWLIEL